MILSAAPASSTIVLLFSGAGLVIYLASRAAADAVTTAGDPSPGRAALAQWIPIAWCALLATLTGRADIGIGVVFATSVAGLSLVLGVLLAVAPTDEIEPVRASAWPFVLPGAVLTLMAGFTGALALRHAVMLLAVGLFVWAVWRGSPEVMRSDSRRSIFRSRAGAVQLALSVAIAGLGAWMALKVTIMADDRTRIASGALLALAVLSPLLMLPVIGVGASAVQSGRTGAAVAQLVGITLLNLYLLLPLITLSHYLQQIGSGWIDGARSWEALRELELRPLLFPIAVWRVDTVLLIVLGLFITPVALGRWTLHKSEGVALAVIYAAYLVASTALAMRL